ncbi:MAG: aromatic aminobenezylarsenical efflux permease ArsG family transporter [candidate division Zixibacteria bacterium]
MAIGYAVWLGILTSISPCPMATNIAAMSYIGKNVERPSVALLSGILYTIGRMITYIVIGALAVTSVLSIPDIAMFLQQHMNKFLGPILIIVGLLLLEVFKFKFSGMGVSDRITRRVDTWGIWGAGLFGILFALSFCPVSAALFFGSLIPLAIEYESSLIMPTAYGIGTALPVVIFALLIAFGTRFISAFFNRMSAFEKWARRITAIVFIVVGFYLVIVYIFNVQI